MLFVGGELLELFTQKPQQTPPPPSLPTHVLAPTSCPPSHNHNKTIPTIHHQQQHLMLLPGLKSRSLNNPYSS